MTKNIFVEIIPQLKDNYSYLVYSNVNKLAVVIDPADAAPIIKFIKDNNIHTPIPDCFLNGITRQAVIEMVKNKERSSNSLAKWQIVRKHTGALLHLNLH